MVFGRKKNSPEENIPFEGIGDLSNWDNNKSQFYSSVKLGNLTDKGKKNF